MWWVTPSPPPDLGPKLSLNKWIFSIAFNLPIGWLITCSTDWLSDQLAIWQASNYWINADCKNRFCNFVRVWFQANFSHFPSVSIIHIQFSNSLSSNCFQFLFSLSNMAICRDLTRLQSNIFLLFLKTFLSWFCLQSPGKGYGGLHLYWRQIYTNMKTHHNSTHQWTKTTKAAFIVGECCIIRIGKKC